MFCCKDSFKEENNKKKIFKIFKTLRAGVLAVLTFVKDIQDLCCFNTSVYFFKVVLAVEARP